VLDLTNTTRYYDPAEFTCLGVQHVKIPCRGRGRSPDPTAVNQACWEIRKALLNSPETYILVHCTHGFNRTGYVICSALCRLFAAEGIGADRAVRRFSAARAPGIYKKGYLDDLFWQHHERRPPHIPTPEVPLWKRVPSAGGGGGKAGAAAGDGGAAAEAGGGDESSDDDEGGNGKGNDSDDPDAHVPLSELTGDPPQGAMHHDDVVGEAVPEEEAEWVRRSVFVSIVAARDFYQSGQPPTEQIFRQPVRFPGSQPVSLDRRNLELVQARRYLVTWKADGTRFLLAATHWGCYLLDRAFVVRRAQARFPTLHAASAFAPGRPPPAHPVGPPHVFTLLDGEMVVDEDRGAAEGSAGGVAAAATTTTTTSKQRRRYLAYDIMVLNTESVADLPFSERIRLIEREVERPRTLERQHFAKAHDSWRRACAAAQSASRPSPPQPFLYSYDEEPFGVRRKDFWPVTAGERVCRELIPRLTHESDGLILQAAADPYVPYTCEALLKWKFAHLNSVDFVLRVRGAPGGKPQLLLKGRPRNQGGAGGAAAAAKFGTAGASVPSSGGLTAVDNATVHFPPELGRAEDYDGRVVECSWDKPTGSWVFLRERTDKTDPNAFAVFEKVVGSIVDDIQEGDVLRAFDEAVRREGGPYGEERRALMAAGGGGEGVVGGGAVTKAKAAAVVGGGGAGSPARAAAAVVKAPPPPPPAPAPAAAPRPKAAEQAGDAAPPPAKRQARGAAEKAPEPEAAPFVAPRPPTLAQLDALEAEEI
jgi:mRNA-capping enzyme